MAKTLLRVSVALLCLVLAISIIVLVFSVLEYQARNPTVPTPPPIIINSEILKNFDEHPEQPTQIFNENPVVYTEYGGLRGLQQFTLFENKSYYAFKGIPYAKPPLAELRFKPPQRAVRWFGIRDAYEFGSNCVQRAAIGNEDCLFVNVYTPKALNNVRFPVIMAIHGGAFTDTSADTLGPDFLLNQDDVVVVTFNYRLGPLGFMSLRTPEYSGNMGLKDQLLAMQWTLRNIHNFGGDNTKITLYGISAGAQSAHMHVLSPASQGLFNRVVMASGTALNPSSISSADHAERLRRFASENGNAVENDQELIEYLHRVDAHLLTINTTAGPSSVTDARRGIPLYWVPVVEPIGAEQPFLTTSPSVILDNNFRTSVDLLFTFVSAESYWFIDEELRSPVLLNAFDEEFEVQMPVYPLNMGFNHSSDLYRSVLSPKIRSFYFAEHDGRVNENSLYEYSKLVSDTRFNYAVDHSVRLHAATGPGKTFYLRFSVDAMFNFLKMSLRAKELGLPGATHAEDTLYLWGTTGLLSDLYNMVDDDSVERRVVNEFSKLHTNFMRYGTPVPTNESVKSVEVDQINFLDFKNEGWIVGTDPNGDRMQFWSNLISMIDYN